MKKILIVCVVVFLIPMVAIAEPLNNKMAVKGLTETKFVVDVTVGDPELLMLRMDLLDTTYSQLIDAGVTPTVVVAFRGKASRFITKNAKYLPPEHQKYRFEMKTLLEMFNELGFTIEQCGIAAAAQKINPKDFFPQVRVVQNSYISLIGYQNQGYAFLPMD
jgi:intracellular sulfur oxidation DsrE/DsrF family protein